MKIISIVCIYNSVYQLVSLVNTKPNTELGSSNQTECKSSYNNILKEKEIDKKATVN